MQIRFKHLILTAVTAIALVAAEKPDPAQVMLEAARKKTVVDGDLKAAIKQYGDIAAKYGKSDRAVTATALVRMAECYAKLGDAESRKIYERVIREYADQKEAVTMARAHLGPAESIRREATMATRQVWVGHEANFESNVSADGRYLSYVDWETGNLVLHAFATSADRSLTHNETRDAKERAQGSAISKDGKQVAYSWINDKHRSELRVVSVEGASAQPRRLLDNEDVGYLKPFDWSADGKWIAVQLFRGDRTTQLALVAVADGSVRVLKSSDWRGVTNMFFAPDGKNLAFDLPVGDTTDRSLFVLAVDGSREVRVPIEPGRTLVAGWSPDGKRLLFASDRGGSMGLWSVAFEDGRPQGMPQLIKPDVASWPMGVTTSGALYFAVTLNARDIHVATVDLNSGKLISGPTTPIQNFVGTNDQPAWSADGKYLAYSSRRIGQNVLAIRSIETSKTRELLPELLYFNFPRWSPDGRSFVASGTDPKGREGIFQIDASNGAVTAISLNAGGAGKFWPEWSPDGKKVFYRNDGGANPDTKEASIIERDMASGIERELSRGKGLGPGFVSPDGRHIVATTRDATTKSSALLLIPLAGGEPRELLRITQPQLIRPILAWTPDSGNVLVIRSAGGEQNELWLVPVVGAPPRKIDVHDIGIQRLHPDGRQIAFVSGKTKDEVWALENFLPPTTTSK